MTGGILQIATKGVEDTYLTDNPMITFFKTVYKRHTNFSRDEIDLHFNNNLDFNKEGCCNIEKYGDLLHRLYLIIELPKIEVINKPLYIKDVLKMLSDCDIIWNVNKNCNDIFNRHDLCHLREIIKQKKHELKNQLHKQYLYDNSIFDKIMDAFIKDFANDNKICNYEDIQTIIYSTLGHQQLIFPQKEHYYEKYNKLVNIFIADEDTKNYAIREGLYNKHKTQCDILNDIATVIKNFVSNPYNKQNPFCKNTTTTLYILWNDLQAIYNGNQYCNLIDFDILHDPLKLYERDLEICTKYNSLKTYNDICNFAKNIINQYLTIYTKTKINEISISEQLKKIKEYEERLLKAVNMDSYAKFAWIKKIGHYIIDNVYIKINDQIIDRQYGEWLEIWHELTKQKNKENGYNKLIGNIENLHSYNNQIKNKYELVIPLQFWFNKHIGLSLPILALHHSDIKLYVKLRSLNEVSIYDDSIKFKTRPKLKCKILAEYIYLEKFERYKMATSKLEYFIDTIQHINKIELDCVSFNGTNKKTVEIKTRFTNPCKEIIWVLQRECFIKNKLYCNYSFDLKESINPIYKASIKFDGKHREQFREIEVYNYVYPYERHSSTPSSGINLYSFSLDPDNANLYGSANLSELTDLAIEFNLKDKVLSEIIESKIKFRFGIYAITMNILRICSGMSGLLFEQ